MQFLRYLNVHRLPKVIRGFKIVSGKIIRANKLLNIKEIAIVNMFSVLK